MERERLEMVERERLELVERERSKQERMERERNERERMERERMERERIEQKRVEREQDFLFRRLRPVEAGYQRNLCCMDGTRKSLLNQVMDWVANKSGQENVLQRKCVLVLWFTWNRKNVACPFDLCKPSQAKSPCWSLFLPEGRPEFEQAHKHPSDLHPQTHPTLSPLSNHCSKTPSR